MQTQRTDFLVIGSGLAGLAFALKAAGDGHVTIITKEKAPSANTTWAQGGIAAVMAPGDSFDSHIRDTLRAGAGLCRQDSVQNIIEQAPERIKDLLNWGVHFDHKADDSMDLTREGGHSERRILHFEDHTGSEIHRALLSQCQSHPNVEIIEEHFAIDLIVNKQIEPLEIGPTRCVGAYVLEKVTGEVKAFLAKAVVLSTGGAGKVYLYTTNWSGATGDGIA
ncbi:MAG: FAD-dependent oxidoreductase, partial [Bdellovibrio sp.]